MCNAAHWSQGDDDTFGIICEQVCFSQKLVQSSPAKTALQHRQKDKQTGSFAIDIAQKPIGKL